jgi:hypothetical protein
MTELERDLRALAALVDLPAERDLWPGVEARLASRPRRPWARPLVVALVAAALAIGVAFAVPQARSAILRLLGFEDVTIVRVQELPPVGKGPAAVGRRVTLDEAKDLMPFHPLLPDIGKPDAVYVDPTQALLTMIYGKGDVRLRVTEAVTGSAPFEKIVYLAQHVERVQVNGGPGYWVAGAHVISGLFGEPQLSTSALIWKQLPITARIEGKLTKEQALRIARSMGPG